MLDQQSWKKLLLKLLRECWHLQQDVPLQAFYGAKRNVNSSFFPIFYMLVLWHRRDGTTIKIEISPRTCESTLSRSFCWLATLYGNFWEHSEWPRNVKLSLIWSWNMVQSYDESRLLDLRWWPTTTVTQHVIKLSISMESAWWSLQTFLEEENEIDRT